MSRSLNQIRRLLWPIVLCLGLAACSWSNLPLTTSPVVATFTNPAPAGVSQTPTPFQSSPTPAPLAARVNGLGITLSEYQAELSRYQAASGTDLAPEDKKRVLDDLIDQVLLSQAANEKGFVVDPATLQQHIDQLANGLGGDQSLASWMAANGYVEESFRQALARSIAAAWMRDQIQAGVPKTAEQVHARQILLYNADQANEAFTQLQAGKDFASLASEYDPVSGGDLGWFPRGYLPDPELEQAAFSLEAGQYSQVIQTETGFHILQVIERDPQHALEPDALLTLQTQALQKWLETRRSQSDIQILVP